MRVVLLALSTLVASIFADEVSVTWRHELSSGRTALEILDLNNTILAESCGSKIGTLDFSSVDKHGGGSFAVGNKTYAVLSQPDDGPICNRIYNHDIAIVECTGVNYAVPEDVAKPANNCFLHEDNNAVFERLRSRNANVQSAGLAVGGASSPSFYSRILGSRSNGEPSCQMRSQTSLVGDGDPHQNFYDKQISVSVLPSKLEASS